MQARAISPLQAIAIVSRGVMIETIRRKDLYVLIILSFLYVAGMLISAMVGVKNHATVVFLLNLGITFAWFSSHLLALMTAARQIPEEMENRTLHPLLAKPLKRSEYILGKWISATAAGWLTLAILLLLSSFPRFFLSVELQLHTAVFLQALVLCVLSVGMVTAIALIFSLLMPKAMNIVLMILLLLFGNKAANLLIAQAGDGPLSQVMRWVTAYVPNFAEMNLFDRYTDGMAAIQGGMFAGLVVYGALFIVAPLAASIYLLNRRPL